MWGAFSAIQLMRHSTNISVLNWMLQAFKSCLLQHSVQRSFDWRVAKTSTPSNKVLPLFSFFLTCCHWLPTSGNRRSHLKNLHKLRIESASIIKYFLFLRMFIDKVSGKSDLTLATNKIIWQLFAAMAMGKIFIRYHIFTASFVVSYIMLAAQRLELCVLRMYAETKTCEKWKMRMLQPQVKNL